MKWQLWSQVVACIEKSCNQSISVRVCGALECCQRWSPNGLRRILDRFGWAESTHCQTHWITLHIVSSVSLHDPIRYIALHAARLSGSPDSLHRWLPYTTANESCHRICWRYAGVMLVLMERLSSPALSESNTEFNTEPHYPQADHSPDRQHGSTMMVLE